MAKRKKGDEAEWPDMEGEQEGDKTVGAVAEPAPLPESNRPKTVSVITPQGIQEVSTDPTDLDEYEGSYTHIKTGETFGLKVVENDPHGQTHQLKNTDHFWAGTADEFRAAFDKE